MDELTVLKQHDVCSLLERWEQGQEMLTAPRPYGSRTADGLAAGYECRKASVYMLIRFAKRFKRRDVLRECRRGTTWKTISQVMSVHDNEVMRRFMDRVAEGKLDHAKLQREVVRHNERARAAGDLAYKKGKAGPPDRRSAPHKPRGTRRGAAQQVYVEPGKSKELRAELVELANHARRLGGEVSYAHRKTVARVAQLVAKSSALINEKTQAQLGRELHFCNTRIVSKSANAGDDVFAYVLAVIQTIFRDVKFKDGRAA